MKINFDTRSVEDYRRFLAVRRLPLYRFRGTSAEVPEEYVSQIGLAKAKSKRTKKYEPTAGMFDYQRDITELAIQRQKYAIFADCGLGKTLMLLEFARHVASGDQPPVLGTEGGHGGIKKIQRPGRAHIPQG